MKLFGNSKGAKTKQTARSAPKKAAESKSPNAQKNKSVKAQKKRSIRLLILIFAVVAAIVIGLLAWAKSLIKPPVQAPEEADQADRRTPLFFPGSRDC